MIESKVFAPDYPREDGLILFPRDTKWQEELLPFEHPARANLYLIQELIRYVSEPGETILDPFGGTGALLIGALEDRHIILIGHEQHYLESTNMAANIILHPDSNIIILAGWCREVLPVPCDHIITSLLYGLVEIWQKMYKSLRPDGTMSIVVKNRPSGISQSEDIVQRATAVGFKLTEQYRWKLPEKLPKRPFVEDVLIFQK